MHDDAIARLVFWLGAAIPVYAYLGYPVALVLLRGVVHRRVRKAPCEPSVSLIVPAHDEAAVIERKIANSLALDYPAARLEVLIASDGSTDGTAALARRHADGVRVRVLEYREHRGKMRTMNAAVPEARGEITIFSDAAGMLHPDAVRALVTNFADPRVGAVSGTFRLLDTDGAGIGRPEALGWRYETFLKARESEIASVLGAHGDLYAIRKALYPFPSPETINDDFAVPISVLGRGYRAVYEPAALASEEAHEMRGFGRRVRIMTGNIQQLREIRRVLRPLQPLPLFCFLSHKVARVATPFGMCAALAASVALLDDPFHRALCALQAAFYAMALLGVVWQLRPRLPRLPRVLLLPSFFCMINLAAFVGLYHTLTGRRTMAWK